MMATYTTLNRSILNGTAASTAAGGAIVVHIHVIIGVRFLLVTKILMIIMTD
jgi:hypothetical protein